MKRMEEYTNASDNLYEDHKSNGDNSGNGNNDNDIDDNNEDDDGCYNYHL